MYKDLKKQWSEVAEPLREKTESLWRIMVLMFMKWLISLFGWGTSGAYLVMMLTELGYVGDLDLEEIDLELTFDYSLIFKETESDYAGYGIEQGHTNEYT